MPNLKLQNIKKKIEPEFEGIKNATERGGGGGAGGAGGEGEMPKLQSQQRMFLMGLTGFCPFGFFSDDIYIYIYNII